MTYQPPTLPPAPALQNPYLVRVFTSLRPESWIGGATAMSSLFILAHSVQSALLALLFLAALVSLKDIVWDYLILDAEEHQIRTGAFRAALAFCATYLAGMVFFPA